MIRIVFVLVLGTVFTSSVHAQNPCKPVVLSPASFSAKMTQLKDEQLVDIRDPDELKYGYLEGAKNINYYDRDFEQQMLSQLKKDKPLMIYCMSGYRSAKAAKRMCELGFKEVYDLQGGAYDWEKAGFPIK